MGWSQGSRLSGSQEAASCQQIPFTETHLLRMSIFPLNPSKGFPESSSMSTGPRVFEVMILCVFMALKSESGISKLTNRLSLKDRVAKAEKTSTNRPPSYRRRSLSLDCGVTLRFVELQVWDSLRSYPVMLGAAVRSYEVFCRPYETYCVVSD
ncbi:hypothetical protein NQZ68_031716 [Dissostichus eleginoides]|nr:hypothetical protein NQZ68_031716 [Dissostichus eleginoides]